MKDPVCFLQYLPTLATLVRDVNFIETKAELLKKWKRQDKIKKTYFHSIFGSSWLRLFSFHHAVYGFNLVGALSSWSIKAVQ